MSLKTNINFVSKTTTVPTMHLMISLSAEKKSDLVDSTKYIKGINILPFCFYTCGLTPFKNDFGDYVECEIPIKDVT